MSDPPTHSKYIESAGNQGADVRMSKGMKADAWKLVGLHSSAPISTQIVGRHWGPIGAAKDKCFISKLAESKANARFQLMSTMFSKD